MVPTFPEDAPPSVPEATRFENTPAMDVGSRAFDPSALLPVVNRLGAVLFSLSAVVAVAHLFLQLIAPKGLSRPLLWTGIVYGFFICGSLVLLGHGAGKGVLRLLRTPESHLGGGLVAPVLQVLAGWFAMIGVMTAVGSVHRVDAFTVTLSLTVAGALAIHGRGWARIWTGARTPGRKSGREEGREEGRGERGGGAATTKAASRTTRATALYHLLGLGAAIFFAPFALQLALPNTDWDSAMYHLPLAQRFVADGLWRVEPLFEATAFPGGVHLLYSLLLVLGAETAIIPLNFVAALMSLALAGGLATQLAGRAAGVWAAAAFTSVNLFWELGFDPRIDGFLGLFSLAAVACVVLWAKHPYRLGLLPFGGLALGLAFATKYTAVFVALTLVPLVFVLSVLALRRGGVEARSTFVDGAESESTPPPRFHPTPRSLGYALLLATLLAAIPSGFWYARNAIQLGDPLYPMLGGRLYVDASGQLSPIQRDWERVAQHLPSPPIDRVLKDLPPPQTDPRNLFAFRDMFLDPMRYARKSLHWLSPALFAFVLLPWARRDRASLILFTAGLATYGVIGLKAGLVRYAMPVLPVLAVGSGVVLARLGKNARLLIAGPVIAAMLLTISVFEWKKVELMRPGAYLLGKEDRLEWLSSVGYNFQPTMPRVVRQLNRAKAAGRIPDDAVVFMIGEGKGHLLDLPHIPDSTWNGARFLAEATLAQGDTERMAQSLYERGVRYVLFNRWYFRWVLERIPEEGRQHRARALHLIQSFLDAHGTKVLEHADMEVHRLEPGRGLESKDSSRSMSDAN